jgi:hypothetical protein
MRVLRPARSRLAGRMALATKHGPSNLWMERDLIMLTAIIANYIEAFRRVFAAAGCRLFRAAFCATLWGHHIALVEHLLFLFCEQKDLLTLNTRNFYVRHGYLLCTK